MKLRRRRRRKPAPRRVGDRVTIQRRGGGTVDITLTLINRLGIGGYTTAGEWVDAYPGGEEA